MASVAKDDISGLDESACLVVKNIGKPCAGEPQARFDEGGQGETCSLLYLELSNHEMRIPELMKARNWPDLAINLEYFVSQVKDYKIVPHFSQPITFTPLWLYSSLPP
jgi:hypothetical protein